MSYFPSFKKHQGTPFNAIWKAILRDLNYVHGSNKEPMEKTWFMAPVEYNPNGKDITAPMEYILMVHSPNGKGIVLRKTVFGRDNCHGKR